MYARYTPIMFAITLFVQSSLGIDLPLTGASGEKIFGFGRLSSFTYTPNGMDIITSSSIGTLEWNINPLDITPSLFLSNENSHFTTVTYSRDGTLFLAGNTNGVVTVWDSETKELKATLPDHPRSILAINVSHDNKHALITSGNLLTVWDIEQEFEVQFISLDTFNPGTGSFSPNGKQVLAIANQDNDGKGIATLWDWESGEVIHQFLPIQSLFHLGFSPDGRWIITSGDQQEIRLWNSDTFELVHSFTKSMQVGIVTLFSPSFCFSSDGMFLFAGNLDSTFTQWEIETGKEVKTFAGHNPFHLNDLMVSPDGQQIASSGSDHKLKLWDVESGGFVNSIDEFNDTVRTVNMSQDGLRIVQGFGDGTSLIRDTNDSRILDSFSFDISENSSRARATNLFEFTKFSSDGKYILAGGFSNSTGEVLLWNAETHEIERRLQKSRGILSGDISPNNKYIVIGTITGNISVLDRDIFETIHSIDSPGLVIRQFHFLPDNLHFLSSGDDGLTRLWNVETGNEVRVFQGHRGKIWNSDITDDGRFFLTGGEDSTLRLWDVETGNEISQVQFFNQVDEVAISSNGKYALLAFFRSEENEIVLWDLEKNQEITKLFGHSSVIMDISFTPGNSEALSASIDGTTRLWNLSEYIDAFTSVKHFDQY